MDKTASGDHNSANQNITPPLEPPQSNSNREAIKTIGSNRLVNFLKIILALMIITFLPFPYFQPADCSITQVNQCPSQWHLAPSIFRSLDNFRSKPKTVSNLPSNDTPTPVNPEKTSEYRTYRSLNYPIELKYPSYFNSETELSNQNGEKVNFKNTTNNTRIIEFSLLIGDAAPDDFLTGASPSGQSNINGNIFTAYIFITGFKYDINPSAMAVTSKSGVTYYLLFSGTSDLSDQSINEILRQVKFTSLPTTTPTPTVKIKTYSDEYFKYTFNYPENWRLRQTYNPQNIKAGKTEILSGLDLHLGSYDELKASIVINVLSGKNQTDIEEWIRSFEPNIPLNSQKEVTQFAGYKAVIYKFKNYSDRENETIYFLKNNYLYRIDAMEIPVLSSVTQDVISTFKP